MSADCGRGDPATCQINQGLLFNFRVRVSQRSHMLTKVFLLDGKRTVALNNQQAEVIR